ncbi:MAG: molybdopterin biosynthesis protein [Syntrophomonadaceae bacterium]|jgi:molybdenum cofactor synthesis domain-containing protein
MNRNVYIDNMPLEKALELFINRLNECNYFNLQSEQIDVLQSRGRITASPVFAVRSSPHYTASAMDGIAVESSKTFLASEFNPVRLIRGQDYIEVDTGDFVPRQYDAVIMIEEVNFIDNYAQIIKPAVPWQNIRSVGEDLVARDMIIPSLYKIGPYEIASFLTGAIKTVNVIKQPVVSIIPTGTELVDQGSENMAPGEIVESNSRMLEGLCIEWGAIPLRHDIIIDDKQLIKKSIITASQNSDMIVVCSGSSAGREDYTASIISELGELLVHGLATKPGKPAILGIIDNKPVIGVPGYPLSAQLIFELFGKPILFKKQGLNMPQPVELQCCVSRKISSSMGVDEFIQANAARINKQYIAYPLSRGAGITTSLVKSDGFIHIPRGYEGLQAGETCLLKLTRPLEIINQSLVTIGSHDLSIDLLTDILIRKHGIRLISSNAGSMGGIMALRRNEAHLAGIHLLDTNTGDYNTSYLNRYLPDRRFILINLVIREQGLLVKPGNPLKIKELSDLTREEVRFINRQKGSGTRVLLDYLLTKAGIEPSRINGYNREEFTHLAVGAAVKSGGCDVGLGIYTISKALDIDFVPISQERYDVCILTDLVSEKNLQILINAIRSAEFKQGVAKLGGYNTKLTGEILLQK